MSKRCRKGQGQGLDHLRRGPEVLGLVQGPGRLTGEGHHTRHADVTARLLGVQDHLLTDTDGLQGHLHVAQDHLMVADLHHRTGEDLAIPGPVQDHPSITDHIKELQL